MREGVGNIWDYLGGSNAVCVTTNGHFTKEEKAVMGAGLAQQAVTRFPGVSSTLGLFLAFNSKKLGIKKEELWNVPYLIHGEPVIFSFPTKPGKVLTTEVNTHLLPRYRGTKPGKLIPGWKALSTLEIIERSARILVRGIDLFKRVDQVILPQPGCGLGGLEWVEVEEVLRPVFDDRFLILTYQKK